MLAKLAKRVSFFAAPFALVLWVRRACKVPLMHHASHNSVPARSAPVVWVSRSSAGQGLTNRSLPRDRKVSLLQPVGELWSSSKLLPLPLHFFSKKKFMNEFLSQPISRTKASPKPRCGPSTPHSAWPPCWFPAPRFLTDQLVPLPPPGRRGLSSGQLHEVPTDKKSVAATDGPKDQGRKKPLQIPRQALEVGVVWQQHECIRLALPWHSIPLPLLPALLSRRERISHPNEKGLGLASVETSHHCRLALTTASRHGSSISARTTPASPLTWERKAAKSRANPPAFVLSTHTAGQSVSAFPPREPVNVPGSPDGPPLAPAVISPRPTANHDSASIPRCHSAPLVLLCLIRGNLLRLPPRPTSSPRGFAGVCVAHPA